MESSTDNQPVISASNIELMITVAHCYHHLQRWMLVQALKCSDEEYQRFIDVLMDKNASIPDSNNVTGDYQ